MVNSDCMATSYNFAITVIHGLRTPSTTPAESVTPVVRKPIASPA
jgi:hypothetical protein